MGLSFVSVVCFIILQLSNSVDIPPNHWVRIRTLSNENHFWENATWKYNNSVTAEFIFSLIKDLKPNVLERYIAGEFDPNESIIPTNNISNNMTIINFLQKSLNMCASSNCFMTPRISLEQYPNYSIYQTSQFFYNLALNPSLQILSLDNWSQFNENVNYNSTLIKQILNGFFQQGWKYLAINDCGGYYNSFGEGSLFEFPINSNNNWNPSYKIYDKITENETNLMKILSYIDFPGPMKQFANFTGDQQASILESIAKQSQTNNFTNVWNILQGFWDSTQVFTSKNNSQWYGQSIYNVSKQLMIMYG